MNVKSLRSAGNSDENAEFKIAKVMRIISGNARSRNLVIIPGARKQSTPALLADIQDPFQC